MNNVINVHSCVLCGHDNSQKLSFFQFPKDEKRREEWLETLNLDERDIKKDSRLCHQHFSPEDICGNENRRLLKKNVVPKLHVLKKRKITAEIEDVNEIVLKTQPDLDLVPLVKKNTTLLSSLQQFSHQRIHDTILEEPSTSSDVAIDSVDHVSANVPSLSSLQSTPSGKIHNTSSTSNDDIINSRDWKLSNSLSEYIKLVDDEMKHRGEQVEELRRTVQSLKDRIFELEQAQSTLPTSTTPITSRDSDRELLFRFAGDIGTPHSETPRRALRGIRVLRSAVEQERSTKKVVVQKLRRAQRKIDNLNGVIEELRNSNFISKSLYKNMMVTPIELC